MTRKAKVQFVCAMALSCIITLGMACSSARAAATNTFAALEVANTWTAVQTFSSGIVIAGTTITTETGSGPLVRGTGPTITGATMTSPTINGATVNSTTLNSPTLVTPALGVANGTSLSLDNGMTLDSSGLGQSATSGLQWEMDNSTAANNSVNQPFGNIGLCANYWSSASGGTSTLGCWRMVGTWGTGTNPDTTLKFFHSGTSGSKSVEVTGGMKLYTSATKPTCSSTTRGTFWVTQSGAGVKDVVEVCAKDAGDAYAYRTIY